MHTVFDGCSFAAAFISPTDKTSLPETVEAACVRVQASTETQQHAGKKTETFRIEDFSFPTKGSSQERRIVTQPSGSFLQDELQSSKQVCDNLARELSRRKQSCRTLEYPCKHQRQTCKSETS